MRDSRSGLMFAVEILPGLFPSELCSLGILVNPEKMKGKQIGRIMESKAVKHLPMKTSIWIGLDIRLGRETSCD